MKKILYFLAITATLTMFAACQVDELNRWGSDHHIYFEKFYKDALAPGKERADSTLASFFFHNDNVKEIDAQLVVNMTGRLLESDMPFKLKVVESMTTANPDEYTLKDQYIFRANNINDTANNQRDTINITMRRSERLKDMPNGVRLTVELVPLGDLKLGQTERTRAVIILTRDAVKPVWWDSQIENNLFGKYSSKKYKLFLLNIDPNATLNADMLREAPYKAIQLVRKFKQWLQEHPTEAVEENGMPMTVNV